MNHYHNHTAYLSKKLRYGLRNILMFLCFAASPALSGCHDNEPDPDNPADHDIFFGATKELVLGPETTGFNSTSFTLILQAPDGSLIRREGRHLRRGAKSHLSLTSGLKDGTYRLMYLEYPIADNPLLADLADEFSTTQFGLGSRIEIKAGTMTVLDSYDEQIGLPGSGTADDPYEISSYHSLIKLAQIVNSEENNGLITQQTHFRQTGKIDMYQASRETDRRYGWMPIGASPALPFRGHYHGAALSTLIIDRPNSAAVGLFGYLHNASLYDIRLSNSAVTGNFAAGGIAGASLMSGADRGLITMTDCQVSESEISGSPESVGIGALLGVVDMQSRAYFHDCLSESNSVSGSYNAGGLIGSAGLYSAVAFSSCENSSAVTSEFSGAGGLIGTCDTLTAAASSNRGTIVGATRYSPSDVKNSGIGAGGIVGGASTATLSSCSNYGSVSGYAGVGGIAGSARIKGSDTEAYMYGNIMTRYCFNEGNVQGTECVGGIVGEAQAGTYAVYNKGNISGDRYVAGIAGSTSIAVAHNAINTGDVTGVDYVGGIVGKTTYGSLALDHNYGKLTGSGSHLGGITALAGNNTMIHYCGNYGKIDYSGTGATGGIVGEIGDPREWTAANITDCVIGSMEVVMGIVGPVMAVSEHAIEAVSKTLETFLHVTEVLTDSGLLITDSVLWGMGVDEMIEESMMEELSEELSNECGTINSEVKARMAGLRRANAYPVAGFDSGSLAEAYPGYVDNTLAFYESDGGDIKYNERINLTREERQEALEKKHQTDQIIHQVVGGVCIVVGTAATIGGLVASGGAAAPFIIAGSAASIAGGLNAITKSCLEFEENVVVISQCLNAGDISCTTGARVGGLVGKLQDNSILRDCLVTGKGPGHGYPFAGKKGGGAMLQRLLSLSDYNSWSSLDDMEATSGCAVWWPKASDDDCADLWNGHRVKVFRNNSEVIDAGSYTRIDSHWKIGSADDLWHVGASSPNSFPVPARSEMRD